MGTGKLKTRRYKVRRSGRGWTVLVALGLIILAGSYFFHPGEHRLSMSPAPTLTPEDSISDRRTLTLPGQQWYALQLGVFDQEEAAQALAQSFRSRGAGGYVTQNPPYRVLAAAYETRADAQAVQNQLRALHGVDAYVHEMISGEIVVNVSGQKAQLAALSDAYDALSQTTEKLSNLSQGLDRHTLDGESIAAALKSEKETLSSLAGRIQALFGEKPHEAVREIDALLQALSDQLGSVLGARSELQLGAGIKHCQLLCIDGLMQYTLSLGR